MARSHYNERYRAWLSSCVTGLIQTGIYPGIIFINNKKVGQEIRSQLEYEISNLRRVKNFSVVCVSTDLPLAGRKSLAESIRQGNGPSVIVSTQIWATGIDLPPVRWIVLDPGIGTAVPSVQSAGRSSRLSEGKAEYQVLIPPGKASERQRSGLKRAGYDTCDVSGPYANADVVLHERDTLISKYEQDLGRLKYRAGKGDTGWVGEPVGTTGTTGTTGVAGASRQVDSTDHMKYVYWFIAAIILLWLQ